MVSLKEYREAVPERKYNYKFRRLAASCSQRFWFSQAVLHYISIYFRGGMEFLPQERRSLRCCLFSLEVLFFLEEYREKNIDTGIKTGSLWMRKKWKKQKKIDLFVRIARIRWRKKNLIVPSAAESYRKRCKGEILSLLRPRDEKRTMVLAENAAREFPIETDLFQKN